jgi:predicted RNase H-like nuclease (RuvC/YqgF family)
MAKITHFDIGARSRQKAAKKQEIIAKNHTISELNENIVEKTKQIKDLKRKVGAYV